MIRFGIHCSLRKGLVGALDEGKAIGCESIQLFTRSPRMWRMSPHPESEINDFINHKKELNITPIVVHAPYLPNLATSNKELYLKSKRLLQEDMVLAEQMDAKYLVIHPGSYSENSEKNIGINNIADAINHVLDAVPGKSVVLLENVAGGGRRIGSTFKELNTIIKNIKIKKRIGICFDTAHAFASGYDIRSKEGIDQTIREFDSIIGLNRLKVIHFNDSKVPLGSQQDRHQHLGEGFIGSNGFKHLIKKLKTTVESGILETPKESDGSDKSNLSLLHKWRDQKTKDKSVHLAR